MANRRRNYNRNFSVNILLVCVSIYALNELYLKDIYTLCRCHLNDLIAMPLLLGYANILFMINNRKMRNKFIIALTFICCITWEYGAEVVKPNSTIDYLDMCCYMIGAITYIILRRMNDAR